LLCSVLKEEERYSIESFLKDFIKQSKSLEITKACFFNNLLKAYTNGLYNLVHTIE
jgi:hypothetical protein